MPDPNDPVLPPRRPLIAGVVVPTPRGPITLPEGLLAAVYTAPDGDGLILSWPVRSGTPHEDMAILGALRLLTARLEADLLADSHESPAHRLEERVGRLEAEAIAGAQVEIKPYPTAYARGDHHHRRPSDGWLNASPLRVEGQAE